MKLIPLSPRDLRMAALVVATASKPVSLAKVSL